MIEQLVYTYFHQLLIGEIDIGTVLNVGLGKGYSARFLLDKRSVETVTTVEWDQDVIDEYTAQYGDELEDRHTIVKANVLTGNIPGTYDLIYIDLLYSATQANYDQIKTALLNLASNTVSGTHVLIEWGADSVVERALKEWLDTVLDRTVLRGRLGPFGRGRAGDMLVYRKP